MLEARKPALRGIQPRRVAVGSQPSIEPGGPPPITRMDSGAEPGVRRTKVLPLGEAVSGLILSGDVVSLLDMTEIQLLRPEGLVASPAFSHVAVVPAGATTVYVGGQNAVDHNGELVGGTDVAAQTRQVMANLVTALQAAGAGIEHLVSVLVMLVEGVDVQAAYAAAAATLGSAKAPPLVSAAIVSGLGVPGAMVEVSAIAATPDRAPAD